MSGFTPEGDATDGDLGHRLEARLVVQASSFYGFYPHKSLH